MNKQKRRRIMRVFKINELSAVDRPAQGHALAVLIKRVDTREQQVSHDADTPHPFNTLEDAVAYLQSVQGMTKLGALERAGEQHPDLVRKFNSDGEQIAKAAADEAAKARRKPKAAEDFEGIVSSIAKRDGLQRHRALEIARLEHPDQFEAYQAA